jgi:hypothetical protein
MDERAYREAQRALNHTPCVFEKALLARCTVCELAARQALAEREIVGCTSPVAQTNCATFIALLRERAAFALKLPRPGERLAHAVTMKLQCGSVAGLQHALNTTEPDVHRLVLAAQERWGGLMDLPWPTVVQEVVAWQGRRRPAGGKAP